LLKRSDVTSRLLTPRDVDLRRLPEPHDARARDTAMGHIENRSLAFAKA
jgi:hypothetical protein